MPSSLDDDDVDDIDLVVVDDKMEMTGNVVCSPRSTISFLAQSSSTST